MALKKRTLIPDDNHLIRRIPWNNLLKDEQDNVIGILGEAFKRRNGESYLSANQLEHFSGIYDEQIINAVKEIRKILKVRPKNGFAIGRVGNIKSACAEKTRKIYVVSWPTKGTTSDGQPYKNDSHVAINSWPDDDMELLDLIASDAWGHLVLNNTISD